MLLNVLPSRHTSACMPGSALTSVLLPSAVFNVSGTATASFQEFLQYFYDRCVHRDARIAELEE